MKILITGAGGLVGTALVPLLTTAGHSVRRLVRGPAEGPEGFHWDPARGELDAAAFDGVDAVVHLAGQSLAVRWDAGVKERILRSRVDGTRLLAETMAGLAQPPAVFLSMSAVGYYGSRGDELLDETATAGSGFLADVCRLWEGAAEPARAAGIRVVHPRLGMVLSPRGGALAGMLRPFRMGVGGRIGSGAQYWPWISIEDAIGSLLHALVTPSLAGPVNLVAPQAVTNAEFTRALAGVLHRPALLPLPAFAARLVLSAMADELLLGSQRVVPEVLTASGYPFQDATLVPALQRLLGLAAPA